MASARLQTRLLFLTAVIFAASALSSQSGGKSATPDLTKFSSDQLTACYNDLKACGAKDIWAISDEFTRRLPSLSSERLVACFDDWHICGVGEGQASGWGISDELARRGQIHSLILRYWHETNWVMRDGIEHVAYHFHNPEVTAFMRKVLAERVYDGEDRYWPVNYLAKRCDHSALKELSSGRYRNQGSMQYQTSVELFGTCHYRPAIPYLVDTALYDFSGNITDAADDSLHVLYPDAPKNFDSLEKSQKYFCQRARKEHLKVNCKVPRSQ